MTEAQAAELLSALINVNNSLYTINQHINTLADHIGYISFCTQCTAIGVAFIWGAYTWRLIAYACHSKTVL